MIKKLWNSLCLSTPLGACLPILCVLAGAFFVGISPIIVKLTTTGPVATAFYRIFFALPLIWVWLRVTDSSSKNPKTPPSRNDYLLIALAGVFFSADLSLWYYSLSMTSVVNATLFNNFGAFFVPLILWVIFAHRPPIKLFYAAILGLAGATLLAGEKLSFSSLSLRGDLCALGSAVCVASYYIIVQHLRKKLSTPTILWGSGLSSCCVLAVVSLCFEEHILPCSMYDCLGLLTIAIFVHIAGQGALAQAMGHLSASFLTLAMLLSPVISAILAWFLFGETMTLIGITGCTIILISIFFAQQQKESVEYATANLEN